MTGGSSPPMSGRATNSATSSRTRPGRRHGFIPTDKLSRFNPNSIWLRDRYGSIMHSVDTYGDAAVAAVVPRTRRAAAGRHHAAGDRRKGVLARGSTPRKEAARSRVRQRAPAEDHPMPGPVTLSPAPRRTDVAPTRRVASLRLIRGMAAGLVPGQVDVAAGDCPHRHRGGAVAPLWLGNAPSVHVLGRRRLDAARAAGTAGSHRSVDAIGVLLFHGALAMDRLPRVVLVLLRRLHGWDGGRRG